MAKAGRLEGAINVRHTTRKQNRPSPAALSPPLPSYPLHDVSPAILEDSTHSDLSLCLLDMFLGPTSPLHLSVFLAPYVFLSSTCTTTVFPHATVRTKLLLPAFFLTESEGVTS